MLVVLYGEMARDRRNGRLSISRRSRARDVAMCIRRRRIVKYGQKWPMVVSCEHFHRRRGASCRLAFGLAMPCVADTKTWPHLENGA